MTNSNQRENSYTTHTHTHAHTHTHTHASMHGSFGSHGLQMLHVQEKSFSESGHFIVTNLVFFADFLDQRGNGRIMILRDTRKEMMHSLIVESTTEQSCNFD